MTIRSKENGQRPSPGSGDRGDSKLITAIDVRTLVAIHLYGDELAIDDLGNIAALIRLAVHHVTPVTPDCADVEQYRLVLAFGRGEGFFARSCQWIG